MKRRIGVVVVTHNSASSIGSLLDSIPAAAIDLPVSTVVVDSGSSDQTVALVESRDDCQVLSSSNVGYAAAINRGAELVTGVTEILVLNPDLVLSPGCLPALVAELDVTGAGIVVPRLLDGRGTLSLSLRNDPTIARALGLSSLGLDMFSETISNLQRYRQPTAVDWATGAAMLIAAGCFAELDGWDESFFLYSEETDFCLRARQNGWTVRYTPAAEVVHTGGGSGRSDVLHGMQLVNRVRLYGRHHARPWTYLYLAVSVMAELSWIARRKSGSTTALKMLVMPGVRPPELKAGRRLIPH